MNDKHVPEWYDQLQEAMDRARRSQKALDDLGVGKPSIEVRLLELIKELQLLPTHNDLTDPFIVLAEMNLSDALENYREYKKRT